MIESSLSKIVFLQIRFKYLIKILNNLRCKQHLIEELIYQLSHRISCNFQKEIINHFTYNKLLGKLEILNKQLSEIITTLNLKIFKNKNYKNYKLKITKIQNQLLDLIKEGGIGCFKNFLDLYFTNNSINKNLVDVINNCYNITELNIYPYPDSVQKTKSKNLIIYKNNDENNNINYDITNISKVKDYLFTKQYKKNCSLTEKINGAKVYIKVETQIIVLDGYFNSDPLNIYRNSKLLINKSKRLNDSLKYLKINSKFKNLYYSQISLRNFVIYSIDELIDQIKNDYFLILSYKSKTLSVLVKDFLSKKINEQINLITLFLIYEEDTEIQNMAYLLYEMICNESYLLKPSNNSDFIFNSLHWSIQKSFKVLNKKINSCLKELESYNSEQIPYEKQIYMLKASKSVKQKAMDKYKEISNKSNENSSKAIQYLDTLLKIPFGVYQKEDILIYLDKFIIDLNYEIKSLKGNTKNNSNEYILFIENECDKYLKKNKVYFDDIFYLINTIDNYKQNKLNIDINIDSISNIEEFVNNFVQKTKNKDIDLFINKLNKEENLNYKIKTTKKAYIKCLFEFFKTKNGKKYLSYIDINKKFISNKSDNFTEVNKIIDSITKKYNSYKSNVSSYLNESSKILDKAIYGQYEAKNEIKRIISQWINGEMTGYCLGFEGPPGTGKTTIAKKGIAECLKNSIGDSRPFSFIALGGSSNGSTLEGHNYTYLGSTHGKIVDILIDSKCMNPIIYIDELDKISNTENGKELIGILTHLTDSSQNEHFNDKYFSGVDFDLSKVLFIFSYNDYNKLDRILADRIHRVKFNYLSKNDKLVIMNNYLIPTLTKQVGIKSLINFSDNSIEYIIDNFTCEGGVRKLKERTFEIIRQINVNLLNDQNYIQKLELDGIFENDKINVNRKMIDDILFTKSKMIPKSIKEKSYVGVINGLYATAAGTGGLTVIEACKTFNDTKLGLVITGQQGDVMKESINCAKTIAWNLLPEYIKSKIYKDQKENMSYGIHIHCPDAATPKDGPSAGTALTLAILSLLSNIRIKNNIAITGEIDLNGCVRAVGGIDLKIEGAKSAGVETVLLPFENESDFQVILKTKKEILENLNIKFIKNVWEAAEIVFEPNNLTFEKYIN